MFRLNRSFLINNYQYFVIIFVIFVLSITNVKYGHFLTGWDNLQVELNYWENLRRSVFSAWQEYQGLGLAAGHAHAVESVRLILYLPAYLVLPTWFFRYFFHISMLLVGTIYFYKFISAYFKTDKLASLSAALFYLLNIGTVQIFYAPLEPFSAFWGLLPFVLFYNFGYLKSGTIKSLTIAFTANIIFTMAFQIQTFAVVYSIIFLLPLCLSIFIPKFLSKKRIFLLLLFIGLANLYWVGNAAYFYLNHTDVRFESLTNKLASEDSFLMNVAYANSKDLINMKGFWFSNVDYDSVTGQFVLMMQPWINWLESPVIKYLPYLIFSFFGLGLVTIAVKWKKNKASLYILYLLVVSLFFLFNVEGILGFIYRGLSTMSPTFEEIFRFPFTKWANVYVFAVSLGIGVGLNFSREFLSKKYRTNGVRVSNIIFLGFAFIFFLNVLPVLRGGLFYDRLELKIPDQYFAFMDYMGEQDSNRRIMNLPQNSFWGWFFTDWGYRGSGFIWWGLNQPILDRAFDVWNFRNEQYFREIQYAIYAEDIDLIDFLINKYDVGFVYLDKSIIVPNAQASTFYKETIQLLNKSALLEEAVIFGDLYVYKVKGDYKRLTTPPVYNDNGTIYSSSSMDNEYLINQKQYIPSISANGTGVINRNDKDIIDAYDDGYLIINKGENLRGNPILQIPSITEKYNTPFEVNYDPNTREIVMDYPDVKVTDADDNLLFSNINDDIRLSFDLANQNFYFRSGTITEDGDTYTAGDGDNAWYSYDKNPSWEESLSSYVNSADVTDCLGNTYGYGKDYDNYPGSVIVTGEKGSICLNFNREFINLGPTVYEVSFEYKSTSNTRPYYCILDVNSNECINAKYENGPDASFEETYKSYKDYIYIEDPNAMFTFHLANEVDSAEPGKAYYRNINLKAYAVNQVERLPIEGGSKFSIINLKNNAFPIKIDLSGFNNLQHTYLPGSNDFLSEVKNCDNYRDGVVSRILEDSVYNYSANNGVACDLLRLNFLNTSLSYLVTIENENVAGKNLDLCIASTNFEKCIVQDRTTNEQYKILLPSYSGAGEYYIDIRNQSYGYISTKNILKSVTFKYIPYDWIKSIYVSDSLIISQQANVIASGKTNYGHEEVEIASSGQGLLKHNQSYDSGWILLEGRYCGKPFILPFICNSSQNSKHLLVDNWANSWLIEDMNGRYVVYFLPQLLQLFGTTVVVLAYLGLVFVYLRKRVHREVARPIA